MHVGRPALPRPGFGSPKAVKGLHQSGLEMVVVHNNKELLALNNQKQGAIVAATVGNKKRAELLKLAQENKITVLNVKDLPAQVEGIQKQFEERKILRKKKLAEASVKEDEKKKKAEEKKKKEEKEKAEEGAAAGVEKETLSEEEKQKELVEKTITKRQ